MALEIGFIGCGWVAGQHVEALSKIPDAQITAFCDVDEERAVEAAAHHAGAGAYVDYHDMLADAAPDAVYVCVPPHAHGEIEAALIERRVPFFLEKPLANDLATAQNVLEQLEGADLITGVGYLMRWQQNVARVKEFLTDREPVVARGTYLCSVPPPPWWRRKEQSGGQIVEQSTHIYDLTRYLFGDVETVFCRGRRGLITEMDGYTVDDASVCTLQFASGVLCEITSSCACQMTNISLEVFTRDGRALLSEWPFGLTIETASQTRSYPQGGCGFLEEDQAFVAAVLAGDASGIRSTYRDAFRTHAVTCAAEQSMSTGEPVQVG